MANELCAPFGGGKFARCLINTLLNLAAAMLELFKQFLLSQILLLDAAIAALIAQLVEADILAIQVRLAHDIISGVFDGVTGFLNGLPLGLLDKECTDWAGLNGNIQDFINDEVRPPVDDLLDELERILSVQQALSFLKRQYEETKQTFLDMIDLLEELILEQKCREAAAVA